MRRKPGKKPRPKETPDYADPLGMAALGAQYFESLKVRGFSPETLRGRTNELKLFAGWAAERGLTRPSKITRAILERYQRHLFHYADQKGRKLALRSQLARLSVLRGFFRYLSRQNLLLHNPAAELELPRVEKRLPRQVMTIEEVEKVLSIPPLSDPIGLRDRAILEVLYSTGMRRLELSRLKLTDVEHERGLILVREGKFKKDRMVPVGERALLWIDKYLADVRPVLAVEPDEGFLFLSNYGQQMMPKQLSHLTHRYIELAGIGKTGSCHLFRHTAATLMLEGGADIRFIQQLLGHANITSTEVYTRVAITQLKAVHANTHPGARLRRKKQSKAVDDVDAGTENANAGRSDDPAAGEDRDDEPDAES